MTKSFTGAEFIKALSEGTLREPIVKEGMVKPVDDDPNAIQFSAGTSCLFWTNIPVEMIERVEYITTIRCRDHEHPLVRLYLKEPSPGNKEAGVLAGLLRSGSQIGPGEELPDVIEAAGSITSGVPSMTAASRAMAPTARARVCAAMLRCCLLDQVPWCCDRVDRYCGG